MSLLTLELYLENKYSGRGKEGKWEASHTLMLSFLTTWKQHENTSLNVGKWTTYLTGDQFHISRSQSHCCVCHNLCFDGSQPPCGACLDETVQHDIKQIRYLHNPTRSRFTLVGLHQDSYSSLKEPQNYWQNKPVGLSSKAQKTFAIWICISWHIFISRFLSKELREAYIVFPAAF